jgi:hypothetical protein
MRTTESVVIAAEPSAVYPYVVDLGAYPRWLPLVHAATPAPDADPPAWEVELRARVGPFARSKRLRMALVEAEPDRLALFERAEIDGRDHARWALRAELVRADGATEVVMHLAYDGGLWVPGVLGAVLDEQVRRGRTGLSQLVTGSPGH